MPYVLLVTATVFLSFSGIGASFYNRKNAGRKDTAAMYNLIQLMAVFLFWFVKFLTNPEVDLAVLPYSLLFTLGYTAAISASVSAYREGSLVLSSLIMQLSMITTSIWGFFFWNSTVTPMIIIGLILVVLTLWLCLYQGKAKVGEKKKITPKWLFYISLYFVGNSLGSIVARTQQLDFEAAYGDFFMMVATGIGFVVCGIRYLRSDKTDSKAILRSSWYIPALSGAMNFVINLIVLILATSVISPTIVYPFMAVGALAITTVVSIFIFKEKMRWWQWIGIAVGALAIVLLSI